MPLSSLIRRLRPLAAADAEALAAYRERVTPIAQRVAAVRDEWLESTGHDVVDDQAANTASVHRWELARLLSEVDDVSSPPVAASAHQQLRHAVEEAARGCQLLATGSRFHKSEAICDGQVLLVKSAESVHRILADLDDRLARR